MSGISASQVSAQVKSGLVLLVDSVVEPRSAFRALAESPRMLVAIVGSTLCQLGMTLLFYTPNMRGVAILVNLAIAAIAKVFPIVVVTGWVWMAGLFVENRARAQTVAAVVSYCMFAASIVTLIWTLIEAGLGVGQGSVLHPVYSNLAFLAPNDDFVMQRVGQTVDVLSFYHLVLLTIGTRALFPARSWAWAVLVVWSGWAIYNGAGIVLKLFLTH
jgi:hypothetical protein